MARHPAISPARILIAIRTDPLKSSWLFVALLVSVGFILMPPPSTMISLDSTSETVTLNISTSETGSIFIASAWDELTGKCVQDVRLEPKSGASVSYARKGVGPLYITATGGWAVRLSGNGVDTVTVQNFVSYELGNPKRDCDVPQSVRLPATGYLIIGSENIASPDEETLLLLEAELAIYGRSIDRIFSFIPLKHGPFRPNSLYFVEDVSVPYGSRVANARGFRGDRIIWWGAVDVRFGNSSEEAMKIRASANAASVDLFAPPPTLARETSMAANFTKNTNRSARSQRPDTIHFSYGSRLLQDPNLRWLYALVTGVLLLVQFAKIIYGEERRANSLTE